MNTLSSYSRKLLISNVHGKALMMYEPIRWYIWCAENLLDSPFSDVYAAELEAMVIPGGPRERRSGCQTPMWDHYINH
jgi:hypothetical protein